MIFQFIKDLLIDIKTGKNIDLAILFFACLVLTMLGIFGIANSEWIVFGLFMLISYLLIMLYNINRQLQSSNNKNLSDSVENWHNYNLRKIIGIASTEIIIINRVGYNSIHSNYARLASKLQQGVSIRILIGTKQVAAEQSRWSSTKKSEERYKQEWEDTIMLIRKMKNDVNNSNLELRAVSVPLAYSGFIIDSRENNSKYVIAPYSYPTSRDYGWQIVMNNRTNSNLSRYIEKDFLLAWEASTPIDINI